MLRRNTPNRAIWKDADETGIRETLSIGFAMPGG
jgi:hypothetical protein